MKLSYYMLLYRIFRRIEPPVTWSSRKLHNFTYLKLTKKILENRDDYIGDDE